jgi:hypothetical protein
MESGPFAAFAVAGILALGPGAAGAHEFWLSPSSYRAATGDTLTIRAYVGGGFRGELKPYAAPRTVRFVLQAATRLDLMSAVTNGELRWAFFRAPDDGGQLLAFESNFALIELPAERFDRYLASEGLDSPRAARAALGAAAGAGRERYARCAKTWIAGRDPKRVLQPQGLPLEIVPLADPAGEPQLPIQVFYRGKPLAGALVRSWNRPLERGALPFDPAARDSVPPAQELRTQPDGTARLDVQRAGEWLINVVHMVPSEDRKQADWQSLWASFTFARSPASTTRRR